MQTAMLGDLVRLSEAPRDELGGRVVNQQVREQASKKSEQYRPDGFTGPDAGT